MRRYLEGIRFRWRHKGRVLTIGLVSSEEGKTPEPPFHVHTQERPCEDTVRRWLTDPASRRSVQFNHLVISNSLQLYGLQHTRLLCPSPTPGLTQTHVHWVGDAFQSSHPLSSPSPPAFNLSQHQGLFKCVSSSHQVAKVLEFELQHQSFQRIFRTDFL